MTGRLGILLAAILAMLAVSMPAAAGAKDSNQDRIPDRWEKKHNLTLKKDQRKLDQDKDGLKNRGEYLSGTSPRDKDSDDDGVTDVKERAGVISAYDAEAGTLTISLYAGGDISGSVTDRTKVKCDSGASGEEPPPVEEEESGDRHGGPLGEGSEDESGEEGPGHHGQGRPDHGGCHGDCSLEDLAAGVEVLEAEVKYTAAGPVFTALEIERAVTEDDSDE